MVRMHLPARLKSSNNVNAGVEPPKGSAASTSTQSPALGSHANGSLILKVNAIKGRGLAAKDKGGSSDPYLVLVLGDVRNSTVSIPKSLNPEWNETIELPVTGIQSLLLEVNCWDKDRFGKDYMGEVDVPLEEIFAQGAVSTQPTWYPLESRKAGRKKSVVTGEVLLAFSLSDPLHASATPQQILQKLAGIVAASSSADEQDDPSFMRTNSLEQELEEDDDDTRADEDASDTNQTESVEKRKRRRKLARLRRQATQRAYEFSGKSDIAGVLFLEVSKITDLPPERNMTRTSFDMDAFVITSLGKKTYKTKVIRHNLNPVYDEKLVFQVLKHESKYHLKFTVVDRDKLSGNDFIGTCDFPLENIASSSADPDPKTGLYPLREPESFTPSMNESKKSRFRLPLSRSASSQSIKTMPQNKSALHQSTSQSSLNTRPADAAPASTPATPPAVSDSSTPSLSHASTETTSQLVQTVSSDDPDLHQFILPISLRHKERWEDKHKPTLFVKAKYLPYEALRQQFWRAMLRQYDADDSGYMSKVELTTMLDTLGSTLHESTIDGFFSRFEDASSFPEPALTYDQAVICLEDQLKKMERENHPWRAKTFTPPTSGAKTPSETADMSPPRTQAPKSSVSVPTITHEHNDEAAEDGQTLDTNDLADDQGEEHVVEIRECPICHLPRLGKRSDADIITHIATCASQDWRQVNNIVMAGFVTSSQAQRKWYSKVVAKIGYGGYKLGANSANILVQDRITGQINEERMSVYVRLGIRLLYKGLKSRDMEKKRIRNLLRSLSYKQGRKFDDPASAAEIQSFVNFHQLDMSEVLLSTEQFRNFNEFFYRALKPDARPCSAPDRPEVVTSPADCRSVVFDELEEAQSIWVKGREFTIERLFGTAYPELAKRYEGGALGIFRLAPQDYHRFHIPVDGIMGEPKLIEGEYYTVNPMAIRSTLDVYGENIRVLVPIDSEAHGKVMVVCVGAMMVGSTVITRKPGEKVHRAEELGYFKFGGSTILLLFEPGRMVFDSDLRDNSTGALETLIRVGMSVGHTPKSEPHREDMQKAPENITESDMEDAKRRIAGSMANDTRDMPGPTTSIS